MDEYLNPVDVQLEIEGRRPSRAAPECKASGSHMTMRSGFLLWHGTRVIIWIELISGVGINVQYNLITNNSNVN